MTIMFRRTYYAALSAETGCIPIATLQATERHVIVVKNIVFKTYVAKAVGSDEVEVTSMPPGFRFAVKVGDRELLGSDKRIWTSDLIAGVVYVEAVLFDVKFVAMEIDGLFVAEDDMAVNVGVFGPNPGRRVK